ncbi:LOW QUALITY PROTEIN: interaptin-like [Pogonomyrmex barbatus]|uniref:LOW QUALITY PROTEIN: interaptin-like n=1 Tax=Pogonomyrmex barbatus TaxID=144034 RepID=A0A6I9WDY0_9HYME|nr:LOW QUALITY PROTEIN: interaptin-like [Pogonomyrmex barbatus]
MDLSINTIHRILVDAGLPSTIEDLKNPTEKYVVNLLTTFLSHFSIDLGVINQPIAEQLTAMPHYEDSDIINLTNLHAIVAQIFDKIFLSDFCLTDITSPGQKRFRRQVKLISNFVLYAMHKKSEFNDRQNQIQTKSKLVEELKEKKAQTLDSNHDEVMHKAKELSKIERLENEIQCVQLKVEKFNKRKSELKVIKIDVEKENQKAKELCGSIRISAAELSKKITEIQAEIVHSPEKYQIHLDKIKEEHESKMEARDIMQEAIQEKKQTIKQIQDKLHVVQEINEDFSVLRDIYTEQKTKTTKLNDILKKTDSLEKIQNELENKLAMNKDQMNDKKNKLQSYHEEDIVPLSNLYNQLLSEKKVQKATLDTIQNCFKEKCLKKNEFQADVKKTEEETVIFMNNCQKNYDKEIANELELWKAWKEK